MNKAFTILAAFGAITASVQAANVSITPSPNANVITSTNQPGQAGWLVQIGFFKDFTGAQAQLDKIGSSDRTTVLDYLHHNFVPLGVPSAPIFGSNAVAQTGYGTSSTAGITSVGTPPVFTATGGATGVTFTTNPANSLTAGGLARGTRVFLVIFDAPTQEAATELGIFSATTWVLSPTATNMSLATTQVDTAAEAFRGAVGSLRLAPLVVVPEPSTSLMALLAGMGLIARRRR